MHEHSNKALPAENNNQPSVVVIWDPAIVIEEDYVRLIEAVGNVVRAHGGLGVTLLRPNTFDVAVHEQVVL